MKAGVLTTFFDKEANKVRWIGSTFEVDPERFAEINATSAGKLIEEIEDDFPIA